MARLDCIGEPDLQAFLLGQLPAQTAQAAAAHLEVCPDCETRARQLDQHADPLIRSLRRAVHEKGLNLATLPGPAKVHLPPGYPGQPTEQFGRFRILRELGRGGFGVVFLADDPLLGRQVALKVPRPEAIANRALRERFLREARAAGRLDHPHVAPVHEAGEVGTICYLVSAYCPGPNLADWLRDQGGPIPAQRAATLVAVLADAVQHAHAHGIYHRDLKPANVLLQPLPGTARPGADELEFIPRLTDFGLAKLLEAELEQTSSGVLLGTPPYMAPEQTEGWSDAAGAATDVYALGVIFYELLTGRLPFLGPSLLQTLEQVRAGKPCPLRKVRPELPLEVENICLKCLRRDPAQRYESAAALAADLRRFRAGEATLARPLGWGSRFWNWCRQPQRLDNAAASACFVGLLSAAVSLAGVGLLATGLLPVYDLRAALGYFFTFIFVFCPAQFWIAFRAPARNRLALWLGLAMPFFCTSFTFGAALGYIPTGGITDMASDPSAWQAQTATVSMLYLMECVSFVFALIAYYANRHIPGFVPAVNLASPAR